MPTLTCRIVVLNFNGRELLSDFLPSILESARASSFSCPVTVLDNASLDGSADFIKQNFPGVDVYKARENKVLCSYNEAAAFYKEGILIFLNNDIRTEKDFVDPLMRVFSQKEDAFFAASYGDRSLPVMRWGILGAEIFYDGFENAILKEGYTFSAGVGAFHRQRFLELGGYDEMYLPGYYEDVDLCYRAWKAGYKGYYVPRSRQFHVGGASFSRRYDSTALQRIVFRNSVLFMAKNVTDGVLLLQFIFFLSLKTLMAFLFGRFFILKGFRDSMELVPRAFQSRKAVRKNFKVSDREVLRMLKRDISRAAIA